MAVRWNGFSESPSKNKECIGVGISTSDKSVLLVGIGFISSQEDLLNLVNGFLEETADTEGARNEL